MNYDKKPSIIKFNGSKLYVMQQLTDQLATKMGKSKFNWENKDLENNISLADAFNELTKNLNTLGNEYVTSGCDGVYYGSVRDGRTSTTTTYSSNWGSVCNKNYNGYNLTGCTQYSLTDDRFDQGCAVD